MSRGPDDDETQAASPHAQRHSPPAAAQTVTRTVTKSEMAGSFALGSTQASDGPIIAAHDLVGTMVDRYRVLAKLGAGGMGEVYRAHDPALDRQVALKVLPIVDEAHHMAFEARLRREAQALARLDHPNVVRVYDVGVAERSVFVTMQLVDGATLADYLRDMPGQAPRSTREIIELFAAAGRGLAAAHEAGIVHRDVKPSNILVDRNGQVFVGDFGLARGEGEVDAAASGAVSLLDAQMTHVGHVLGTPVYMSPEQHAGTPATAASDQFSFCVSLWQAVYGEHPFGGREWTLAAIPRTTAGEILQPPRGSKVPARLERALRRGLAVTPAARWPSMTALVDAIAPRSRRAWLYGGLALVAVAAGVLLTAWLMAPPAPSKVCAAEADRVHAVWPARRAELAKLGTGVALYLDSYADSLAAMRVEACDAADVRGDATAGLRDNEMHCLDDDLRAMTGLVDDLAASGNADSAQFLAAQLPMLGDCSAGAQQMLAPIPAGAAGKVSEIRVAIARGRVIAAIGNGKKASPIIDDAVRQARTLGYAPVTADALLAQAELLIARVDPAGGSVASEAAELATTAHADRIAAGAYTLALGDAADRGDLSRIDVLLPVARAAATRVGTPDVMAAFDQVAAAAARADARYPDALALCNDALAQSGRIAGASWQLDKLRLATLDAAYGCHASLAIARGAYRAAKPWVDKWLAHRKAAFAGAQPLGGFGATLAKLELDYHDGAYEASINGVRYQMAGVEVATGVDRGLAAFDDLATIVRMYRDNAMRSGVSLAMKDTPYTARSGALVAAKDLLAIAKKTKPLDARRSLVAELTRGDVAALSDDRGAMYTHYATALADAEKAMRPDDDRIADIHARIAEAYAGDAQTAEADDHLAQALAIWQRTSSPHVADARAMRAMFLADRGECAGARPLLETAIDGIEDRLDRSRAKLVLAACTDVAGDRSAARTIVGELAKDAPSYSPDLAKVADDWLVTHAANKDDDMQWATTVRAVSSEFAAAETDKTSARWSAKQALGAPNVYPHTADAALAWASRDADAGPEFLELGFEPTRISAVRIYETFNPGAIASVELIGQSGARTKLPDAQSTTLAVSAPARTTMLELPCTSEPIVAVRITLASDKVKGWNELDAVGIRPCR